MLKYGFSLQVLATSTPVLSVQFVVPAAKKLTLVYMSVDGRIEVGGAEYDPPTRMRLAGAVGVASGEAIDAIGLIGTTVGDNRGVIHATDKQAFRGCWELPQGVSTYTLEVVLADGGLPAPPWDSIGARCNLIFET